MGSNIFRNETTERLMTQFTALMRSKMVVRSKKLDGYEGKSSSYFLKRIHDELWELNEAVIQGQTPEEIALECADIANCCMMMADKILEEGDK